MSERTDRQTDGESFIACCQDICSYNLFMVMSFYCHKYMHRNVISVVVFIVIGIHEDVMWDPTPTFLHIFSYLLGLKQKYIFCLICLDWNKEMWGNTQTDIVRNFILFVSLCCFYTISHIALRLSPLYTFTSQYRWRYSQEIPAYLYQWEEVERSNICRLNYL